MIARMTYGLVCSHSHTAWVLSTSDVPDEEQIRDTPPCLRDTVSIPGLGWAKFLISVDVPTVSFAHCHIGAFRRTRVALALSHDFRPLLPPWLL